MRRFRFCIPALAVGLWASSPTLAEMVIQTKDGKTFKVPVEAAEITSIEFQGGARQAPAQLLQGRWLGTFRNSLGDSGPSTLKLVVEGSKVSGEIDGDAFQGAEWDGQALRWTFYAAKNKTTYRYEFRLVDDKRARLTYQASGPKAYSGAVENYVRQ